MIEGFVSGNTNTLNTLTVVDFNGSIASLRVGSIVSAEVMDFISQGLIALRIIPPTGRMTEGAVLKAKSNVPLQKGQNVLLEVLGGGKEPKFRLIDNAGREGGSSDDISHPRLLKSIAQMSISKLNRADIKLVTDVLRSLPQSVRETIPESNEIESLIPDIEKLNALLLKHSVEGSGLMYENRLKIAVLRGLSNPSNVPKVSAHTIQKIAQALCKADFLSALRSAGLTEPDIAALRMSAQSNEAALQSLKGMSELYRGIMDRVSNAFSSHDVINALKAIGLQPGEITDLLRSLSFYSGTIESLIKGLMHIQPEAQSSAARAADYLLKDGVLSALTSAGISLEETYAISIALGGTGRVSDSLIKNMMRLQASDMQSSALERFSQALASKSVQNALRSSGLAQADLNSLLAIVGARAGMPEALMASLMRFKAEGDLKLVFLRFKDRLQDAEFMKYVKQAGHSEYDLGKAVDRFLQNIELLQTASKLNDLLYTFLPVNWDGLKEGELVFKKKVHSGRDAYSCDINLELDALGRVSASVTEYCGSYYVSLQAETRDAMIIIEDAKHILTERFSAAGMRLLTINVGSAENIVFGSPGAGGVDVRV